MAFDAHTGLHTPDFLTRRMTADSAAYVLGATETERQRLLGQIEGLEPQARWLLDKIGVQPWSRAIDVGRGNLGDVLIDFFQAAGPFQ